MAECECLPKCPFFNDRMQKMPALSEIMKNKYCLGDNTNCARYMVFKAKGSSAVPEDLFPSQAERARTFL